MLFTRAACFLSDLVRNKEIASDRGPRSRPTAGLSMALPVSVSFINFSNTSYDPANASYDNSGSNICQYDDGRMPYKFHGGQWLALKVVTVVFATLSIFGSTFIMATFHMTAGLHRSLSMHIVYALSVSDLANSVVYLVGWSAISTLDSAEGILFECSATLCTASAVGQQFFGLGCILWTTVG